MSNNLTGEIPAQLTDLKHLTLLILSENTVSIPEELLKKWDDGDLDLRFDVQNPSVTKITLRLRAPVFCVWERFILLSDGSVTWFHERCKASAKGKDPTTYCEIKEGNTCQFYRLARFLEANGFFVDRTRDPFKGVWIDCEYTKIDVARNGKSTTLEIGPYPQGSLNEWSFDKAIRGVATASEWSKTSIAAVCPMDLAEPKNQ